MIPSQVITITKAIVNTMDEERSIEDLEEEELEDLDSMEEFALEMEEISDIEGLEDIPENEQVGLSQSDMIITYEDKVVDETEELEKKYNQLLEEVKEGEIRSVIEKASNLINEGKRLDAHYLTAKISSLIATLLTSEQKHQEATEYYLLAVSEARRSEDKKLHLLSLSAFGRNLKNFDLKDAAVVFNQARDLANELGEKDYYAENSIDLAHCFFETEKEQAYSLYEENIGFFEDISDKKAVGIIKYRMGLVNIVQRDFSGAFTNLMDAKNNLQAIQNIDEFEDILAALEYVRELIKKGHALSYSLNIPIPEPIEDTVGTKKVFEIYASTGIVDITRRIEKKQLKLISSEMSEINTTEHIFDENKISKLNDTDLLEYSKLYEEIGDLYSKEDKENNSFYNYLGSQLLALQTGNMKRAEKLDKKVERLILALKDQDEDPTLQYDLMMYQHYQLAFGMRDRNPKLSSSYAKKGIEIASKRNNPYYEGLLKEIVADVKSLKNQEKAFADYQAVISIFQELENYVSLMRVYEKIGNIFLFTQADKAKEYLSKALEIAKELEKTEIVTRLEGKL